MRQVLFVFLVALCFCACTKDPIVEYDFERSVLLFYKDSVSGANLLCPTCKYPPGGVCFKYDGAPNYERVWFNTFGPEENVPLVYYGGTVREPVTDIRDHRVNTRMLIKPDSLTVGTLTAIKTTDYCTELFYNGLQFATVQSADQQPVSYTIYR